MESALGQNVANEKNLRAHMEKSLGSGEYKRMDSTSRSPQTRGNLSPNKINTLLGQMTVYNCTLYALLTTFGEK
ncbi:unnamed protein product [Acanthoscelides obtectus]|uniref:Uncharacterized protein n=1 Tax=Acanthoscelides obtectus TaxID=200917 RepID=A0A9P0P046_ACAOB|nr:unnamed protein product [Acanthoscelides obtectus]CAK1666021.1 hypothetical protein AOBTE_LOCUS25117 [Acanthoscelides obtectus]